MSRVWCSKEMFRSSQPSVCIQVGLPDPDRYCTMRANPKGYSPELAEGKARGIGFNQFISSSISAGGLGQ